MRAVGLRAPALSGGGEPIMWTTSRGSWLWRTYGVTESWNCNDYVTFSMEFLVHSEPRPGSLFSEYVALVSCQFGIWWLLRSTTE